MNLNKLFILIDSSLILMPTFCSNLYLETTSTKRNCNIHLVQESNGGIDGIWTQADSNL